MSEIATQKKVPHSSEVLRRTSRLIHKRLRIFETQNSKPSARFAICEDLFEFDSRQKFMKNINFIFQGM